MSGRPGRAWGECPNLARTSGDDFYENWTTSREKLLCLPSSSRQVVRDLRARDDLGSFACGRSQRSAVAVVTGYRERMRLHVHRWGGSAGRSVVCLHGVMGHGRRFRRLAHTALADRRVLAFDLRGHGESGWEPPWNLETHLDDIRESLDAEIDGAIDLVGFSFGGRLALELAAADPERVGRLVLLDPAIQMDPEVAAEYADESCLDVSFATVDQAVDARLALLARTPRELLEEDMAETLVAGDDSRLRYRASRSAVVAAYGEMARPPELPTSCPTLMVRADDGIVDDRQEHLLRAALGERLTVTRVPGSHPVLWDALSETGAAVAAHLG
jgi:lipase